MKTFFITKGIPGVYGDRIWAEGNSPDGKNHEEIRYLHIILKELSMWRGHDKKGRISEDHPWFFSFEMGKDNMEHALFFLKNAGWELLSNPPEGFHIET